MDPEKFLTGENLAFYKNIEYLKILTVKAKAVITRSYATYEDILQKDELQNPARAIESTDESSPSLSSLYGVCAKCGLIHGAKGFCIVHEIIKSEAVWEQEESPGPEAPRQGGVEPQKPRELLKAQTTTERRWEDLHRKMPPAEFDEEYTRICLRHGIKNGRKVLLAHSLTQELFPVEPLFTTNATKDTRSKNTSNSKLSSIMSDCIPESPRDDLCTHFSREVKDQMAKVLEPTSSCVFSAWKEPNIWKKALHADRKALDLQQETFTVDDFRTSYSPESNRLSKLKSCYCGITDCECGSSTACLLAKKKCHLFPSGYNNYVHTIRERLRKRREGIKQDRSTCVIVGSHKVDDNVLRKDSEILLKRANETFQNDLKTCLASIISVPTGKEKKQLDSNISQVADITSRFTKPDDRTWDLWVDRFQEQVEHEDDDGISGNSEIQVSESNSEDEFPDYKPPVTRIPYAEETMKLVDTYFDRIETKCKKTIKKNHVDFMIVPYKMIFYSRVHEHMLLEGTDSGTGDIADRINVYLLYLKHLLPVLLRKSRKLKRLKAKNKNRSKIDKKRDFITNIQLGKYFRRVNRSANFTENKGYVGFKAKERELLQKPSLDRFIMRDLVRDDSDELWLTKEKIHHHYRLLRTLFDVSRNEESLTDKGMKARLENFRKLLPNQSKIGTDTSSGEDALKPVASGRRPSKGDEMKLRSAPENISNRSVGSRKLSERMDHSGFETSFGKSFATSGTRTPSNLTISRRSGKTNARPRPILSRSKDPSYGKFLTQSEPFCLPTPPHSDSSCEESVNSEVIQYRVPQKEESHMEKSARESVGQKHYGEDVSDLQLYFHRRKNCQRLEESEFTDKSSDSYVPKLLNIPQRTSKSPVAVSSYPHRGVAYHKTKGRIPSPYQSDSSSDSEPSRAVRRIRSAWDRKSHRKNPPQKETKIIESRTSPKTKIATESFLPKPGASILKKASLPKPPESDNYNMQYSSVTPVKRRTWSESSYQSSSFHSGSLVRPTHVVTERLLKANQDDLPTGSSKKHSATFKYSRATPESTPVQPQKGLYSEASKKPSGKSILEGRISQTSSKLSKQIHHGETRISQGHSLQLPSRLSKQSESLSLTLSNKQSKQSRPSEANQSRKKSDGAHSRQSEVGSARPVSGSESFSVSSKRRVSRIVGEVFRNRSLVDSTHSNQSEIDKSLLKKEKIVKNKSGKKPVLDTGSVHTESSAQSLVSALRKIAPTKKRVFNVDIGQGINVVTYLKESAPGANLEKQRKLVDLLVTPLEAKKAPKKPASALLEESSDGEIAAPSGDQQSFRSASTVISSSQHMNKQGNVNTDGMQRTNFKTLDQIYKEAHGINLRNTPAILVENEYEHETKKRQQLTKHRLSP